MTTSWFDVLGLIGKFRAHCTAGASMSDQPMVRIRLVESNCVDTTARSKCARHGVAYFQKAVGQLSVDSEKPPQRKALQGLHLISRGDWI